ncbi:helix-turn-helix domain-containing protein [Streptomyces sp. NPDC006662]|uniref:helix-turn-helix domain-containing protein n=1 Tax=Streptomyces sp. NPDC006662 TaxID=3156902 RepID=UPI0033F3EC55
MGRRALPVDFTLPAIGALAAALRELRAKASLTHDELAVKTGLSPTTLKRAMSGRSLPSRRTVTAITEACGESDGVLGSLWKQARIAERGRLAQLRRPGAPELMTARGALSEALEYFYEWAGAPSLRRFQALAGGAHLLPVSSAARIINRQALPASRQQCAAFLTACGIGPRLVERWASAFDRITRPGANIRELRELETALALKWEDPVGEYSRPGRRAEGTPRLRADSTVQYRRLRRQLEDSLDLSSRLPSLFPARATDGPGLEQEPLFEVNDDSGLAA